jgi:hypothetical protein
MMSTFPVREINFNCKEFPSEMSISQSDSRHVGFALRLSCNESAAPGDIVSPGFSSLSSSSANPVAVFDFQSVCYFENIEKVGCRMTQLLHTWICHWCNRRFRGWNATKVLHHVGRMNCRCAEGQHQIRILRRQKMSEEKIYGGLL